MRRRVSRAGLLASAVWGRGSGSRGVLGSVISAAACAAAVFCVSLAVQLALDLERVFESGARGLPDREYVVVSKRIDLGKTVSPARTAFKESEIRELSSLPGVVSVSPVVSNRFAASLFLDLGGFELGTELFFESVPDAFLGDVPPQWRWSEGDTVVPIMISRDFLALYNLGFAASRGLPPVSEGMLGMIGARAELRGPGGSREFEARIAGVTDRLSSILVPESFMSWANRTLARDAESAARRLVVETEPSQGESLDAFLKARGWERMQEGGAAAGILGMGRTALTLAAAAGALLCVLAMALTAFSLSLAVERARDSIGVLRLLGYSRALLGSLIGASGGLVALAASAAGAVCAAVSASAVRGYVSRTLGNADAWGVPGAAFMTAGALALLFMALLQAAGFILLKKNGSFAILNDKDKGES